MKKILCALFMAFMMLSGLSVYAQDDIAILRAEKTADAIEYELDASDKAKENDIYTALYTSQGKLVSLAKNVISGRFDVDTSMEYELKVMLWEKASTKPITLNLSIVPACTPEPTPTPTPTPEPTPTPTPEPTPTPDPYSHEPAYGDIPVVTLTGDVTGISREEYKDVVLTYKSSTEEFTSYAQIKWQGRSSVTQGYPKYNYNLKMFKDELHYSKLKKQFKEWPKAHNYCLKANWIDSTHARNIVSARLAAKIQKNPLPSGETGLIDGFPIHVYLNGEDQGIYTWNIPKKDWAFGIDSDNLDHIAFGAEQQKGACLFQNLSTSDSDWEIIEPEDYPDQAREKFNRMIAFVKDSTVEEYKANFSEYLDMDAMLNYYVMAHIIGHTDGYAKNMIMVTFDGKVWYPSLYDLDSTYGLHWTGKKIIGADALFNSNSTDWAMYRTSNLWSKFEQAFGNEIYERYKELRANELSDESIMAEFKYFTDGVGQDLYDLDESVWEGVSSKHKYIPSCDFRLEQIQTYLKNRQPYLEEFMQSLRTE